MVIFKDQNLHYLFNYLPVTAFIQTCLNFEGLAIGLKAALRPSHSDTWHPSHF
jgi:hypothetical protein